MKIKKEILSELSHDVVVGDIIEFHVKGNIETGIVRGSFISFDVSNDIFDVSNDIVFKLLGLNQEEKYDYVSKIYGYEANGLWPTYRSLSDLSRLLMHLETDFNISIIIKQ